jgi:hypothetical protein
MFKVIVERPRWGLVGGCSDEPKGHRRRLDRIPEDERPRFESSARGRRYGYGCKESKANLAPLRRFLRSRVGRPWNDVHSEICEHVSPDSAVKSHVLDHVRREVISDVVIVDGVPHYGPSVRPYVRLPIEDDLYVHPETGRLCLAPRRPRPERDTPRFIPHPTDGSRQFHRLDGIWYEVRLAPLTALSFDAVIRQTVSPGWSDTVRLEPLYGRRGVYAHSKRQMGKREIRSLIPGSRDVRH